MFKHAHFSVDNYHDAHSSSMMQAGEKLVLFFFPVNRRLTERSALLEAGSSSLRVILKTVSQHSDKSQGGVKG